MPREFFMRISKKSKLLLLVLGAVVLIVGSTVLQALLNDWQWRGQNE